LEHPVIPTLGALEAGTPSPSLSVGSSLLGIALTGLWAAGLWSRVELGYHTPQQVFGGAALGAVLAPAWALVWAKNPGVGAVIQRSIDTVWEGVMGRVLG
jgi:dolichyldiphosphatase